VARAGEMHRVPMPLYRKRYLPEGMTMRWHRLAKEVAGAAWATHCFDMLQQALLIPDLQLQDERLLWLAAVERLTSRDSAGRFLKLDQYTEGDARSLLQTFLGAAHDSWLPSLQARSAPEWRRLETELCAFFELGLSGRNFA
jgi:hypothetical protein